jgi:hypothetical protein
VKRSQSTSKPGELDYVVACGSDSGRYGDGADAVLAAFYLCQDKRLSATVSSDGKVIARIDVWGGL